MYIKIATRYNAWLPQDGSSDTVAVLASTRDRRTYIKSKVYVQVLCLYRNQVHFGTRASNVDIYLAVHCIAQICVTIAEQ